MNQDSRFGVILVVLAAAGAGAWFWLRKPQTAPPAPPVPAQPAPPRPAPPPPDAAPSIRHPVETAGRSRSAPPLPPLGESDLYAERALGDLLGRKGLLLVNVQNFVRGFVATVDNLERPLAPPHLWPVKPAPGRLQAEGSEIGPRNAERYAPLVRLAEAVETRRAVQLYVRMYPLLQQAYEELGYPGKYFNDRVVEVIDHLLATPTPSGPIKVRRLAVEGAAAPSNVYVLEDPALESLSAGQKILLRVGPENAARLKARLTEVRAQLADPAALRRLREE